MFDPFAFLVPKNFGRYFNIKKHIKSLIHRVIKTYNSHTGIGSKNLEF